MNEQNQDALRCADELATGENFYYESSMSYDYILSEASANAAAHIRRLVAENEALREDLRKFREAASCERDLRQEQERHATALVQQMLEALEDHAKQYPHMQKGYTVDAITAARGWLEGKA